MYIPRHFTMNPARVTELLQSATTAQLVTAHEDGPAATLLPLTWRAHPSGEGWGSLIFHVARVNPVWKRPHLGDALAILSARCPTLPLACSGGVHAWRHAAQAIACGATVVQMTSALLAHGPDHVATVHRGLQAWLTESGYRSTAQLRGILNLADAPDPTAWTRLNYVHTLEGWRSMIHDAQTSREGMEKLLFILRDEEWESMMWKGFSPFPGILSKEELARLSWTSSH